jgi:Domain of unknown function (DUF4326)
MQSIKPIGVQRKRTKGFKLPPNTVCVNRGTTWGNPYKVGPERPAENACYLFSTDLLSGHIRDKNNNPLIDRIHELKGKNLACFCPIGSPCHRDILLELASKETQQ